MTDTANQNQTAPGFFCLFLGRFLFFTLPSTVPYYIVQVLFTAVYYSLMKLIKKINTLKKTKQFSCLLGYVLHSLTFHILFQFVCISHFVFIEFQVCYSLLSIPKLSHINVYFSIHQSIIVLLSLSESQKWLEPIPATIGGETGCTLDRSPM